MQQLMKAPVQVAVATIASEHDTQPRTGGRMSEEQRRRRLEIWSDFVE